MSIPWPYSINKKFKAIHLAIDPECEYSVDSNCPDFRMIMRILTEADTWESYRDE